MVFPKRAELAVAGTGRDLDSDLSQQHCSIFKPPSRNDISHGARRRSLQRRGWEVEQVYAVVPRGRISIKRTLQDAIQSFR
jgi:hypothetical protein